MMQQQQILLVGEETHFGQALLVALMDHPEVTRITAIRGDCPDLEAVEELLETQSYTRVLFCDDETQPETVRENLFLPIMLALVCRAQNVHFTYIDRVRPGERIGTYTHALLNRFEYVLLYLVQDEHPSSTIPTFREQHASLALAVLIEGHTGTFNMVTNSNSLVAPKLKQRRI
jgi:hypothetical protein